MVFAGHALLVTSDSSMGVSMSGPWTTPTNQTNLYKKHGSSQNIWLHEPGFAQLEPGPGWVEFWFINWFVLISNPITKRGYVCLMFETIQKCWKLTQLTWPWESQTDRLYGVRRERLKSTMHYQRWSFPCFLQIYERYAFHHFWILLANRNVFFFKAWLTPLGDVKTGMLCKSRLEKLLKVPKDPAVLTEASKWWWLQPSPLHVSPHHWHAPRLFPSNGSLEHRILPCQAKSTSAITWMHQIKCEPLKQPYNPNTA